MNLTQKYIQSLFDYRSGNLYWKINKSNRVNIGDKAGTLTNSGYYSININNKIYRTHRLVYFYHYGYFPKYIDHIDKDKSNNKIENLHSVTQSQNLMNQKPQKNTSSKYKGVNYHKIRNKWRAYIQINGKQKTLGSFKNETDAALAYNEAAIKYFGEFAYLNEVE